MAILDSNRVTGVSTVVNATDAANKSYADSVFSGGGGSAYPSTTGNNGEFLSVYPGSSGQYWTLRTSGFGSTNINAVSYGSVYVSSGDSGTLVSSTDTISWTLRTSGFGTSNITRLVYGNAYVASGVSGTLTASTDAVSWTLRTSGFGTTTIGGLTYSNNEYLIGGRAETVTWTLRTSGASFSPYSVGYGNNLYLVTGPTALITSTDTINWTLRTTGYGATALNMVGYGTIYIASGNSGSIAVSTDGISWTKRTSGVTSNFGAWADTGPGIIYGNGNYLVAGVSTVVSTDTIVWQVRTTAFGLTDTYGFIYGTTPSTTYGVFGRVAAGGLSTSTDTITWILRTTGASSGFYISGVYGNSVYILASSFIRSSTDCITWTARTLGPMGDTVYTVSYGDGIFIAGSYSGSTSVSTDGITWIARTSGFGTTSYSSTFGNGNFLIVSPTATVPVIATSSSTILSSLGNGALLRASTDTITWITRTTTLNTQTITLLDYEGSYALAHGTDYAGISNFLNVSTDNINWQLRTSGFGSTAINTFSYGTVYVAGGNSGILNSSTDAITWTLRTSGFGTSAINTLTYGNGVYFALGASGTITYSTDAITWTIRTSNTTNTVNASLYVTNNQFLYGASSGFIGVSQINQKIWQPINSTVTSYTPVTYKGYQEFTTATAQSFSVPPTASQIYIEAIGAGGGGASGRVTGTIGSGGGGGSGAYNSWLIRRSELGDASPITVTPGTGGQGGTNRGMSTSTDGITWTAQNALQSSNTIYTSAYVNSNYFLGGSGSYLSTSIDGIVWNLRTSPLSIVGNNFNGGSYGITYGNNLYLAVSGGIYGGTMTSTDSIVWTLRSNSIFASSNEGVNTTLYAPLPTSLYFTAARFITVSTDGITWVLRTSALLLSGGGGGTYIYSTIYNTATSNYYLAVGGTNATGISGFIETSTDTISWVLRTCGTTNALYQVLYGNVYVAGGASGTLLSSTDTITWTLRTSGFGTSRIYALSYNSGLYIVGGTGGPLATSTDAIVWTLRSSLFKYSTVYSIAYGTQYIAGGSPTNTLTSGGNTTVSWTGKSPTGTATYTLTSSGGTAASDTAVTAGTAGAAAAVTLNPLYATAGLDGGAGLTSWTTTNNAIQANTYQVTGGAGGAYNTRVGGNSLMYYYGNAYNTAGSASGGDALPGIPGSYTGNIGSGGGGGGALSTGVASWYLRTSGFGTTSIATLAYANGLFVTGGFAPTITWVLRTSGTTSLINPGGFNTGGYPITYDGSSLYLYCGASGVLATSTNTVVWVLRTSGFGTTNIGSVAYGAGRYVACGNAQWITASTDAITWTVRTAGFTASQYSSMLYVNGAFSILSSNTQPPIFINSTDSIIWTQSATFPNAVTSYSAAFTYATGATNPYVVSPSTSPAQILVSTNTIVWTLRTSGTSANIYTFAYNGSNLYVGGGSSGYLSTSTDTISWTLRTCGFGANNVYIVVYNSGIFTAGGSGPTSATSTDAITWILRTSNLNANIFNIFYANNTYIAGGSSGSLAVSTQSTLSSLGNGGLITASTDGVTWTIRTNSNIQTITKSSASNSYYVAGGTNYISQTTLIASTDSVTWFLRTSGFGTSTISALGYGNNEFLASVTLPLVSVTWTLRTSGFGTSEIYTIVYGGTSFVASGVSGTLTSSTDGVSWSLRTTGFGTTNINSATYFNNEYLIGGFSLSQPLWTLRTSGVSSLFRTITYGNGVYVASGGGATSIIVSSTDSITWSLRTSPTSNINVSSTYGSLYLLGSSQLSTNSTIISASTDSVSWVLRTAGHTSGVKLLTYQNSLYFSSSSRGTAFTFTDANAWGVVAEGFGHFAYDGNEFLRSDGLNSFYTTVGEDPSVWILRTTGVTSNDINGLAAAPNGPYVIAGGGVTAGGYIRSSTDGITWFARTSIISSYSAYNVAYYNGIFAVASQYGTQSGSNGMLVTSTDSIIWTARTVPMGFSYAIDSLNVANGFVAGQFQIATYSSDGITWIIRTVPNINGNSTSECHRGAAYGNSVYVIIGGNTGLSTNIKTSTDSISWVLRTSPGYLGVSLKTVAFANNIFIAGGFTSSSTNNIATSTDAIVWILRTSAVPYAESNGTSKAYGNGIVISGPNVLISKNNAFSVSTDSIVWTLRTTGAQSQVYTLTYGNSIYVAGGTGGLVITSTDNISWVIRTQPIRHIFESSIFDGTNYIMGGDRGSIIVSTDSINWSLRTFPLVSKIYDITYNSSSALYTASGYAVGVSNSVVVSTNNIIWSIRTSGQTSPAGYRIRNRELFANSVYVETSDNGVISTSNDTLLNPSTYISGGGLLRASTDSVSWITRTTSPIMNQVNYLGSAGSYSYVSQLDIFSVSTDNINWTLRTTGFSGAPLYSQVTAFVYANNIYILGGNGGQIWASTDTIVWSLRTSANLSVSSTINGAVYGDRFVVVDNQPSVRVSTDSIIWTLRTHGTTSANMDIIYNSGVYSLVANSGVNSTSTDTITWILRTTGFGTSIINSISYSNNIYVIGGASGTLATSTQSILANVGNGAYLSASTDTITWTIRTSGDSTLNINALMTSTTGTYSLASIINTLNEYKVISSTNNIIWQIREAGFGTSAINSFTYGTFYVAAGQGGSLVTSTDSISWTLRTSGFGTSSIVSLTYGNPYYIAAGVTGSVRSSTDGISWIVRTGGFGTTNINSVAFGGSVYVLTGDSGTVSSASSITQSVAGNGGSGTRGGGGGGGGYSQEQNKFGVGGDGANGYVKITWW